MAASRRWLSGRRLAAACLPNLYPLHQDGIPHVKHTSHPQIIARLKRAEGHLRSVIEMIEAGKPCLDLAQQLHAVESAVGNAKRVLIHDHIEHCLDGSETASRAGVRASLEELKTLTKYL
jgi:uncharacterized protein